MNEEKITLLDEETNLIKSVFEKTDFVEVTDDAENTDDIGKINNKKKIKDKILDKIRETETFKKIKKNFDNLVPPSRRNTFISDLIKRLMGTFFFSAFINIVILHQNKPSSVRPIGHYIDFISKINLDETLFSVFVFFVLASIADWLHPKIKIDSWFLVVSFMSFALSVVYRNSERAFALGLALVFAGLVFSFCRESDFKAFLKMPKITYKIVAFIIVGSMCAAVAALCVYSYLCFGKSIFDFGIFVQMFESMITDFSLTTTCERDKFLSHFAVHISPIYYLLYPIYFLFPSPITLLVVQPMIVLSGAVPLWLIAKKYKFSDVATLAFVIIYTFSEGIIMPNFYDFHENAFLPPLLLWFFWACEKKKWIFVWLFAALVLCVKEDAPLYIMAAGIWLISRKGRRLMGVSMTAFASVYFIVATKLLAKFGEGAMVSSRFGRLMIDPNGGFGGIIKNILKDPAFLFSECFKVEYAMFILTIFAPLCFLPIFTKKPGRLLLIVPFLVMNLLPSYGYAQDTGYQYIFGTETLLIYAAIMNLKDISKSSRSGLLAFMTASSVLLTTSGVTMRISSYESYKNSGERFRARDALLSMIPDDASVLSDTYIGSHLAQRKELYLLDGGYAEKPLKTDYIVIDLGSGGDWKAPMVARIISEGYFFVASTPDSVTIYMKNW